jgi:thioester reductase-like protein
LSALLLTGGTGFVGMSVLARLAERPAGDEIVAVVRAGDAAAARARLDAVRDALWDEAPAGWARVRAVAGDLEAPGLGLSAADRATLGDVTTVLHCAASVSFALPLDEARAINVDGTRQLVALAGELPVERFVHVSTAYVSGRHAGTFTEADRALGQAPRNTYEQTKLEAEELVAGSGLPWLIARPSIVVGEARSGWTSSFNVLYAPLRAYARGLITAERPIPADPEGVLDVVPVDTVADALVALVDGAGAPGDTVHLVSGPDAVTVQELVVLADRVFGRGAPPLLPGSDVNEDDGVSGAYAPYFDVRTRFAAERSRALLAAAGVAAPPPLADYFPRLMAYAEATRWGRRPRTLAAARREAAAPVA